MRRPRLAWLLDTLTDPNHGISRSKLKLSEGHHYRDSRGRIIVFADDLLPDLSPTERDRLIPHLITVNAAGAQPLSAGRRTLRADLGSVDKETVAREISEMLRCPCLAGWVAVIPHMTRDECEAINGRRAAPRSFDSVNHDPKDS